MRKFYLMLMLASVLPAMAGKTSQIKVSTDPVDSSHRDFVMKNHIKPQKSLATRSDNVIVTPPDGADIKMYTRSTEGYSVRWGQAYQENDEGIVGEFAFCDNGDVYLKNPISFYITDSWIKGKKVGDNITFTFPQLVSVITDEYDEDGETMEVWINVLNSDYDGKTVGYEFDEAGSNEITMIIDSDGNINYSEEMITEIVGGEDYSFPKRMMALTNSDHIWLGYGDFNNAYKLFNDKPLLIPDNLETLDYAMTFGDRETNGKWVKVAFDEDNSKVYIAGIYTPDDEGFEDLAVSAIEGTTMEGGVSVKSRQYVGIDPYYYHAYLSGGTVNDQYLDIEDMYFMTMDAKRSKMICASTMVVSEGDNQGYVLDVFFYPTFDAQDGYIDPNPAEPLVTGFMPFTTQYGYGGVKVQIPNTNRNGQLLREDALSYSIIINDKQIVFNPEDYPEFSEPTVWIPFNFTSENVEIDQWAINTRMVFMTDELQDVQTISVQSRYKDKDSYYVTNGQTYVYKLPKFEDPVFSPASGYEFDDESGEVTITAPKEAIVSYLVASDDSGHTNFTDADSNIVKINVTKNCFIQAYSKDPEGDSERSSSVVTAIYTVVENSVATIAAELGENVEIYTLDGVRVTGDILNPGLYIIRSDKKTKRVLVK